MSEMNVEENLQYTPERAEQLLQNYRRVLERIRTAEQDHSAVRTEASAPVVPTKSTDDIALPEASDQPRVKRRRRAASTGIVDAG